MAPDGWCARSAIRVLTCNVQRAAVPRACRQAAWLLDVDVDVIVLTEVSADESGAVLAGRLVDGGFGVLLPEPRANDRYRVLVACRETEPMQVDIGAGPVAHRCVAARAAIRGSEIGIVGLYVPSRGPKARRNEDKRSFQTRVAELLPGIRGRLAVSGPVVIAGDLNVVEPDHDPHYAVFGSWEYDFYRAFDQAGFEDAFRIKEPTKREHSWFGRPSRGGSRNGYRFDHAFVGSTHRASVAACHYDHSIRTAGLTDHSALVVMLDATA